MNYKYLTISLLATAVIVVGALWYSHEPTVEPTVVDVGGGNVFYAATSTAGSSIYGAITGNQVIRTGFGTLGSVVVTGANTGVMNFYNATTSDVTKRANATTTLFITSLPASLAAGTYVFDVVFSDGLLLVLESGIMPTTTITHR